MRRLPLIVSIILNVTLVIGILLFRGHVRKTVSQAAITTAEAEVSLHQSYLKLLTSDDPNRYEILEDRIRLSIETGQKAAELFRAAR